jgi:hypothetical protein
MAQPFPVLAQEANEEVGNLFKRILINQKHKKNNGEHKPMETMKREREGTKPEQC